MTPTLARLFGPSRRDGEAMQTVATELRALETVCEELQRLLTSMASSDLNEEASRAVQEVDHTTQRLAGLAQFLEDAAAQNASSWRFDRTAAAERVTPSDLADRLAGRDDKTQPTGNGVIDLF